MVSGYICSIYFDDTACSIFDWVEVLGIDELPCCISRMAKLSLYYYFPILVGSHQFAICNLVCLEQGVSLGWNKWLIIRLMSHWKFV
jgi:hypothetical protein